MSATKLQAATGAVLATLTASLLYDLATLRATKRSVGKGLALSAAIGLTVGGLVLYLPEHSAKKRLCRQELLSRPDIERMRRNLSEILGSSNR